MSEIRRHLSVVPEPRSEEEEVPTGVMWEAPAAEEEIPQAEPLPPLQPTTVYGRGERTPVADVAVAPAQAQLADLNEKLKAALEAANTYALLAWSRRWDVAMAHVMDPALREQMLDAAEDDLDTKRAQAAKAVRRAISPEDKVRAERRAARLKHREVSELEVDARVLKARATRLMGKLVLPAAVVVGPVLLATSGMWAGLLIWPAAWGWLALQGRALARAELGTTTVTAEVPRSRGLAAPAQSGPAPATPGVQVIGATTDENTVLARLSSGYWAKNAKERGLEDITPGAPVLDECGICVPLALGGKWTPAKVRAEVGRVRAMLAVPEGAGVQIMPGATGDQALLRIRTRTPDLDTRWHPGRAGIGIVPDTGRVIELDAFGHRVVAGVTGSGKSTSMRPWMASAVLNPLAALVFLDPKGQEAGLWEHCARTVKGVGGRGQDRIYAVVCELEAELQWRQENAAGTGWTPTKQHPELVITVDEGAALVRMSKVKKFRDVLDKLEFIASQGRACKMWLHWATQYPTKADGIPAQVTENITNRLSLAVDSPQADRVVFGEQATATGWTPSELDMPGWAMVRTGPKDVPEHILMWHMTDAQVEALPEREPWRRDQVADADEDQEHDEDQDEDGDDWIGAQESVMEALSTGPKTSAQLVQITEYSRSMVNRALNDLKAAGRVTKGSGHRAAWRAL